MLSGDKLAGGVKAGLGLREWGWHSRQRNMAHTKEQGGEGNVTGGVPGAQAEGCGKNKGRKRAEARAPRAVRPSQWD